jgi:uncharacterized membrane protein YphA (DoxX/SURF4 family)
MDKSTKKINKSPAKTAMQQKIADQTGCIHFDRRNVLLLGVAVGTIILGYVCLALGRQNEFLGMTASAILLVAGYLVLVPWAILTGRAKRRKREPAKPNPDISGG